MVKQNKTKGIFTGIAALDGFIVLINLENILKKKVNSGIGLLIAIVAGGLTALAAVKLVDYMYSKTHK